MRAAYGRLDAASAPSELHAFGADAVLQVVVDRFADIALAAWPSA